MEVRTAETQTQLATEAPKQVAKQVPKKQAPTSLRSSLDAFQQLLFGQDRCEIGLVALVSLNDGVSSLHAKLVRSPRLPQRCGVDRKFSQALASCRKDRIRHRRTNRRGRDFAHTAGGFGAFD